MTTIYNNSDPNQENVADPEKTLNDEAPETIQNIEPSELSPYMEKFLNSYEKALKEGTDGDGTTVKVSEVLGGLARLYEKIRGVVEYKGEHVLRRNAIERILKRRVWEQGNVKDTVDEIRVSESLIRELIWARYLPNNAVPRYKVDAVSAVIRKYLYFLKNLDSLTVNIPPAKVRSWIWGVASAEIEDVLDPSNRELFVNLMFDWFTGHFKWTDTELTDHAKDIQIFLAIHRSHAKSDEPIMRFHLLLKEYPKWKNADEEAVKNFIVNFGKIYEEIENHLDYKGRYTLFRKIQKHSAAFDIFREISLIEKLELRKLVMDRKSFEEKVHEVCEIKYKQIRNKVNTGIIRSIIYIFLSKVVVAMLVEIPYEILVYDEIRYLPLGINIMFPPFMMWVIGMSTMIPGDRNTEKIISRLRSVLYPVINKDVQNYSVMIAARNKGLTSVFSIFYILIFFLVFGGLSYFLTYYLSYSFFGLVVFFFFLSLVMLFAYRVRYNAVQLKLDSDSETFMGHLGSYLTLPFLNFGFFLSKGLAKINFLSVFLDFIIEAPLKNIIDVFEEWTSFMREKKEEVVERPE